MYILVVPFPLVLLQIGDYFVRLATRLIICLNLLSLNILLICVSLPKEVLSNSGYIFDPCPPRVQSPTITMRHLLQMILIIIFCQYLILLFSLFQQLHCLHFIYWIVVKLIFRCLLLMLMKLLLF